MDKKPTQPISDIIKITPKHVKGNEDLVQFKEGLLRNEDSRNNSLCFNLRMLIDEYYDAPATTRGSMHFEPSTWAAKAEMIVKHGAQLKRDMEEGNVSVTEYSQAKRVLADVAKIQAELDKYTTPVKNEEGM